MSISLYDASIATYLQTLEAVSGFMALGLKYCREQDIDPQSIVETRLYPDMLPFHFQIQTVIFQSVGAATGLKTGLMSRTGHKPESMSYEGLQQAVREAIKALHAFTAEEINARAGQNVRFEGKTVSHSFTAANFLMSFNLPNLFFHATTAYDILRMKGVPVGKADFLGKLRSLD